jgi:hypothetical protein
MLVRGKERRNMPWQERAIVSQRQEFVAFARQEEVNITALCRHCGSSRQTGDTWLERAGAMRSWLIARGERGPGHPPP